MHFDSIILFIQRLAGAIIKHVAIFSIQYASSKEFYHVKCILLSNRLFCCSQEVIWSHIERLV